MLFALVGCMNANSLNMIERITLNIGGKIFVTQKSTLDTFPGTLLASLNRECPEYSKQTNEYYFDRNSMIFGYILDYYRTGELHLPAHVCGIMIKKELTFWNIPLRSISKCCWKCYCDTEEELENMKRLDGCFRVYGPNNTISEGRCRRWTLKIWETLEYPDSSNIAKAWNLIFLILVCASVTAFALTTHPDFRIPRQYKSEDERPSETHPNVTNTKFIMYMTTYKHPALYTIDKICVMLFTIEGLLRFAVCPNKCAFFKSFLNITDLIYLLTAWFVFSVDTADVSFADNVTIRDMYFLSECCVIFRLFRFFRLVHNYEGARIISLTLRSSLTQLVQLCVFLIAGTVVFASIIYYTEIFQAETFQTIPISIWWAVITMTTVGYGDYYPVSFPGQLVASACIVTGIVILAMPVAIISSNFTLYQTYAKLKRRIDRETETGVKDEPTSDILLNSIGDKTSNPPKLQQDDVS